MVSGGPIRPVKITNKNNSFTLDTASEICSFPEHKKVLLHVLAIEQNAS